MDKKQKEKLKKKLLKNLEEQKIWTFKYPDNFGMEGRTYEFVDKDIVIEIIIS